jgi:Ribophorin I
MTFRRQKRRANDVSLHPLSQSRNPKRACLTAKVPLAANPTWLLGLAWVAIAHRYRQLLTNMAFAIIVVALSVAAMVHAATKNVEVTRTIDASTAVLKIFAEIKATEVGKEYQLVYPTALAKRLAFLLVTRKGKDMPVLAPVEQGNYTVYAVQVNDATPTLKVEAVFTDVLEPYPAEITQSEGQVGIWTVVQSFGESVGVGLTVVPWCGCVRLSARALHGQPLLRVAVRDGDAEDDGEAGECGHRIVHEAGTAFGERLDDHVWPVQGTHTLYCTPAPIPCERTHS